MPPPSPSSKDDCTSSRQNSFVIYKKSCFVNKSHNGPLHMATSDIATSEIIYDYKKCYVDMQCDNALDDGPIFLYHRPYLNCY
jgi:hypothetical protein